MKKSSDNQAFGKLRSFLFNADEKFAPTLVEKFTQIEELFYQRYLPLFSPDRGSQTGYQHIKNVEALVNMCLEKQPQLHLGPADAFVLLSSIILHDIGKIFEDEISDDTIKKRYNVNLDSSSPLLDWLLLHYKSEQKENHQVLSALEILNTPEKYGIFDNGLADCIARVCLLHDFRNRSMLAKNGWLHVAYLDRYGAVNIAWLGALLSLADELDMSYHRKAEMLKGSKGVLRSLISGCEVDLVGRTLVIYPTAKLSNLFRTSEELDQSKRIDKVSQDIFYLYQDILIKESMLHNWSKELKQMGMELRSCAVLYRENLLTTKKLAADDFVINEKENEQIALDDFMLTIESNITPMKVDRILEAMFRLRFGVFGKRSFRWEVLASESGMESIAEVKKIYHRIASLSAIEECDYICLADKKLSEKIRFDELDTEWSIKVYKINEINESIEEIKKEICNRFAKVICKLKEKYGATDNTREKKYQKRSNRVAGVSCRLGKKHGVTDNTTIKGHQKDTFVDGEFLLTKNKDLNYLLDEEMCKGTYGRGIFLPSYPDFQQTPQKKIQGQTLRRIGINLVISGPPGIGKTTLASEIIASIKKTNCPKSTKMECKSQEGEEPHLKQQDIMKEVVAFISIEQPPTTVESVIEKFNETQHVFGETISFEIKNLQSILKGRDVSSYDSYMGREYRDLYNSLIKETDDKRTILLSKLSPRFYTQVPAENEKRVFWNRYKQLCRLCENSYWHIKDWQDAVDQHSPPLLAAVVDSLNAFGQQKLNREQIYQLFSMTTWAGILGVFICEEPEQSGHEDYNFINEVEFLSDMFIRLSWADHDYRYKQIEIVKSRYQKHVLGPHPYKIGPKSVEIYPSLHTRMAKEERNPIKEPPKPSASGIFGIQNDSFILLEGDRNTHKLAISMLYVYKCLSDQKDLNNVLVINFGPEIKGDLLHPKDNIEKITDVSTYKKQQEIIDIEYEKIKNVQLEEVNKEETIKGQKFIQDIYRIKGSSNKMFVLTFETGYLMPEECVARILDIVESEKNEIKRIVFFSTYHLPLRFPLLAEDTKFIPYLVRILKLRRKSLLMISKTNESGMGEGARQFASGLESTADYLIKTKLSTDITGSNGTGTKDYSKIMLEVRKIVERDYNVYLYDLDFSTRQKKV